MIGAREEPALRRKFVAAALLIAYLALLVHLTLFRFRVAHADRNFVPFRTIAHDLRVGGREFLINGPGNLAAFVPMGLLLPALLGRRCSAPRVAAISLALSLVIEVLQGYSGRRVADVDDLLLNTAGGLIGYGLALGARRLARGGGRGGESRNVDDLPADQKA